MYLLWIMLYASLLMQTTDWTKTPIHYVIFCCCAQWWENHSQDNVGVLQELHYCCCYSLHRSMTTPLCLRSSWYRFTSFVNEHNWLVTGSSTWLPSEIVCEAYIWCPMKTWNG